jgi:hypothetical protein
VFTKIDRDGKNGEKQCRKEKGTQVFTDDISVERLQGHTWIGCTNIGN